MRVLLLGFVCLPVAGLLFGTAVSAAPITASQIVAIPAGVQGSGNGTLDLRMLTFSGSEVDNASGIFNGDNANGSLPNSGGADDDFFVESYVTTAGDLQGFYALNFGASTVGETELVIFLDLNESGQAYNTLGLLDVVLNPTTIFGSPNPAGDVLGSTQDAINQVFTGGTELAFLSPEPAANLPVVAQGAGFADYAIYTGIDPFALSSSDVLLFNVSMSVLSDGSEEIFLSGGYSGQDVLAAVPEPAAVVLVLFGLASLFVRAARLGAGGGSIRSGSPEGLSGEG